ncbi:hypothetical protein BDM02DRAFT_3273117 [Thelephora ganbajun]|uniref:Uncharacterized protein n=1 Tax=Thelephora ganbajun TaxID=370292 RepID=A0ACB6Z159_THEGA|nr:hypothetical protein BDM02DRAFT_3273117 [Thelephora ganbajun]
MILTPLTLTYFDPLTPCSATPKVNMPTPILGTIPTPTPTPPTPTPGAQVAEPLNNPTSSSHDSQDKSPPVSAAGSTPESPTTVAVNVSSHPPAPTPDATAVPGASPTKPGEDDANVRAKKLPKRKRFRPSQAKNARGVSEREWACANPYGTKAQFEEYFKNLSDERCQEPEQQAEGQRLTKKQKRT